MESTLDKILRMLEELNDEITQDTYPPSRHYISDKLTEIIDLVDEYKEGMME